MHRNPKCLLTNIFLFCYKVLYEVILQNLYFTRFIEVYLIKEARLLQHMKFKFPIRHIFRSAYMAMKKKRVFLTVLSAVILLAVVAVGLIGMLYKNSIVTPFTSAGSLLNSQNRQKQDLHYPDPSNQNGLPDSIKVTSYNETVLLRASVKEGRQIYECQASTTDPGGYAWTLQAPFALLKADNRTNVIHSTGPIWLYTQDGSEVKGQIGQYTSPDGKLLPALAMPDINSVPWLRLSVTQHEGNSGLFDRVDQIQRLYTVGGNAPKDGCNRDAANDHAIQSVAYTAEYVFWGR